MLSQSESSLCTVVAMQSSKDLFSLLPHSKSSHVAVLLGIGSTILFIIYAKLRGKAEHIRRKKKRKEGSVNIGGIRQFTSQLTVINMHSDFWNGYWWHFIQNRVF